ncbi:MAG TPA: DUF433 domain-containing protein [Longimicrobiaceae bacterium]|jgi:uncharacterized protein (DUF433 family)|nr:DUF433 domain-containing protein [Longimicrobiaceae bacterium]
MSTLRGRITVDPAVCHGKPTIRGLRYPVEMIRDLLASGMTADEILADYPDLEREDLAAAAKYGRNPTGATGPS